MEEMWLARDKNGELFIFVDDAPPVKKSSKWVGKLFSTIVEIPRLHFREVKLSDEEPTKVKLVIDK